MQVRSQQMMMSGPAPGPYPGPGGHPGPHHHPGHSAGMPPVSYSGYAPPMSSGAPYGVPLGPEYMTAPGGHPSMASRGPPMQQPMMMSAQGGAYMTNPPGPQYM